MAAEAAEAAEAKVAVKAAAAKVEVKAVAGKAAAEVKAAEVTRMEIRLVMVPVLDATAAETTRCIL